MKIRGVIALAIYIICIMLIIFDFIQLIKGKTFTIYGLGTFLIIFSIGNIAEEYLKELIERK